MVNTLASFPNLPLLTYEQARQVLDSAGLPKRTQAILSGVSRQMLWKCDEGLSVAKTSTLERVSLLAYKVLAYQQSGGKSFQSGTPADEIRTALAYDPIFLATHGRALYEAEFGKGD